MMLECDLSDKPFVCDQNGCKEKFATQDHLEVHLRRHRMCLTLNSSMPNNQQLADQTPTPSRFLGNFVQQWEAAGLSSEIADMGELTPIANGSGSGLGGLSGVNTKSSNASSSNPFAASFQSEYIRRMSGNLDDNTKNVVTNVTNLVTHSLNTPSIMTNNEGSMTPIYTNNEGLLAIADAALNTPDANINGMSVIGTSNNSIENNNDQEPMSGKKANSKKKTMISITSISPSSTTTSTLSVNKMSIASKSRRVGQTNQPRLACKPLHASLSSSSGNQPVIMTTCTTTCVPNITPIAAAALPNNIIFSTSSMKSNTNQLTKLKSPTVSTIKGATLIAPKLNKDGIVGPVGSNTPLYKVILKLPDGRSVQLPLQTLASPSSNNPSVITCSPQAQQTFNLMSLTNDINGGINMNTNVSASASSSPQASVQSQMNMNIQSSTANSCSASSSTSSSSHMSTDSIISDLGNTKVSTNDYKSRIDAALSATLASLPPRAKPGRKSKYAPEEDPLEKKTRSLERNRAAAMRCRLKRKHWVDNLEEKADELTKINERLQNEVLHLRKEVSLLKTALLAHKDCPVTIQQMKTTTPIMSANQTNGDINSHNHLNGGT